MRDILGIIDGLIGDLGAARPDGAMLVFSLSGMGSSHGGSHLLPEVLDRLGLGHDPASSHTDRAARPGWGGRVVAGVRRFVPMALISAS